MKSTTLSAQSHLLPQFAVALLSLLFFTIPLFVFAATSKPSCELIVTTPYGTIKIDDAEKVLLPKGEVMEISWESKNAKDAIDDDKNEIELEGTSTSSPKKSRTYTYRFENGRKKAECEVTVQVVEGSFTQSSLATKSTRPTVTGEIKGSRTVQIEIYKEEGAKPFFTSKIIKVKNGKWRARVTKTLPKGEYIVALKGEKKVDLNIIATSTLTIGSTAQASATTFVFESVPLLNGTVARSGTIVPISYLQVINIGKSEGKVESFSIKQNGSALTSSVVGFTVSDNRSPAVTIAGSYLKPIVFKNGLATIPVDMPIAAGEMRLLTIKAMIAPFSMENFTKQLKLDVAAVATNGAERGVLPIRGTTWTIGN